MAAPVVPELRQAWMSVDGTRGGMLCERPQACRRRDQGAGQQRDNLLMP
jgi:hypothetical protein